MNTETERKVDLREIFAGLQESMMKELRAARRTTPHAPTLGAESEAQWLELLQNYLPKRYQAERAFVLDSKGQFSEQQDIVIFDRQYSPFLLHAKSVQYVPAESVYAVLEVKQTLNAAHIIQAAQKAASVRRLHRTSVAIQHAGGTYAAKPPFEIAAGLLCLESGWSPAFGDSFRGALPAMPPEQRLQCGCCLAAGAFECDWNGATAMIGVSASEHALVSFFLGLLHRLQGLGTVPAMDLRAYAACLK